MGFLSTRDRLRRMPAAGDCELIGNGLLGQPVNALSSLAFVVVALLIFRTRPLLAVVAAAVGLGSFLFHGPMPGWAQWTHDVSLAAVPVALAFENRLRWAAVCVAAVAILFAAAPGSSVVITLGLLGMAAVVVARSQPTPIPWEALGLLVVGASLNGLSRTTGPLCDPDSLLQGHALWHILGAGALYLWARARQPLTVG